MTEKKGDMDGTCDCGGVRASVGGDCEANSASDFASFGARGRAGTGFLTVCEEAIRSDSRACCGTLRGVGAAMNRNVSSDSGFPHMASRHAGILSSPSAASRTYVIIYQKFTDDIIKLVFLNVLLGDPSHIAQFMHESANVEMNGVRIERWIDGLDYLSSHVFEMRIFRFLGGCRANSRTRPRIKDGE